MTAKLLESKKTQGERVLEFIRKNPWCSNVDIIAGTRVGSCWKRLAEFAVGGYVWPEDPHEQPKERIQRRYVDHNGRKIVQYRVVRV